MEKRARLAIPKLGDEVVWDGNRCVCWSAKPFGSAITVAVLEGELKGMATTARIEDVTLTGRRFKVPEFLRRG